MVEFLGQELADSCPKISDIQKNRTKGLLTVEELTKYLKKCKNCVSPGTSGFTNEFYKFFWIDLKQFITSFGLLSLESYASHDVNILSNF